MEGTLTALKRVVARRKTSISPGDGGHADERCLTVVDVTCLGLSTVVGSGLYVLLSSSSKEHAGPSVVLSFLVASVASCLGGLCYSELATRFPRGGSAYAYVYATMGELCAFVVAWATLLDYTFGCALAAKAWSAYVDALFHGAIRHSLGCKDTSPTTVSETVVSKPMGGVPGLEQCPDLLALIPLVIVSVSLATRTKLSCVINNVLVVIGLLAVVSVVLVGIFNMDTQNWLGGAGFFPNGVAGVFCGSSACFLAFIGYDAVASSTPEMIHRSRILPAAISFTFLVGLLSSFTCACAVTLLVPSALLDAFKAPLIQAFEIRKIHGMSYVVALGATAGLTASLIACLYGLSRLLQSLSNDGLIFLFLGNRQRHLTNGHEQLNDFSDSDPSSSGDACSGSWVPTTFGAAISALIACFLEGQTLLALVGMGTLIAFLSAAMAVLCLRYGVSEKLPLECGELSRESTMTMMAGSTSCYAELYENADYPPTPSDDEELTTNCQIDSGNGVPRAPAHHPIRDYGTCNHPSHHRSRTLAVEYVNDEYVSSVPMDPFAQMSKREPTAKSAAATAAMLGCVVALMLVTGFLTVQVPRLTSSTVEWTWNARWWTEALACFLFVVLVACMVMVARQPRHRTDTKNAVPCVPLLPVCAIWMDVHLVVCLPYTAWLACLVWTLAGLLVYMFYGVWHSNERLHEEIRDLALSDVTEDPEENQRQRQVLVESC